MHDLENSDQRLGSAAEALVERLIAGMRGQDFRRLDALAEEARIAAAGADDDALSATAAECRAQADYYLGRYPSALRAFGDAIEQWHAVGNVAGEARSRLGHSGLLSACGLTTESLDQAHAALALLGDSSDLPNYVGALLGMARAHTVLHGWDEAIRLYGRALDTARQRADEHEIGRVLVDLGYFHCERSREARAMGDHARLHDFATSGLACNREALATFRSAGESKLEWIAQMNLGECLMDLGELDEARATIDDVLASVRRSSAPSFYCEGEALFNLGQISLAGKQYDLAAVELDGALAIARQQGLNELVMKSCELLTLVHEARHDFRAALEHHRMFFAVHVEILSGAARLRASTLSLQLETVEARAAVVVERTRSTALALDNLELQRESLEDALTGLPNRRSFQRGFDRFVVEHANTVPGFFLAVIDVDRFKAINDRFSHSTGDDVLKALAVVLGHECRQGDVAARYGGEEFTLLLAACTRDAAASACERVRGAIERHPWAMLADGLAVTASIGFAGSEECPDGSALFGIADRRLYRAKRSGRNRVVGSDA